MSRPSEKIEAATRLFQKGYEAQMRGELASAEALYKESIDLFPTAQAFTFLACTYSFQDRLDEAIEECQKAILVDPGFGNAYNDIGRYLIQLGQYDRAIPWLIEALRAKHCDNSYLVHFNLGLVYEAKQLYNLAIECFQKVLELEPSYELASKALRVLKVRLN